ncbi:hypothetical protein PIROE2DRAFT_10075 [Piromyces sp. E2]|nr:hypothetical protein PIROE2DRAFT_10075 [Piromyces sp. E2]|eukprot:OUM63414.1 hypothetical protein PIROE2DRAFT_10075 [Piromyces sp. E2]
MRRIVKSTIALNALGFTQTGGVDLFEPLVNQFNEYSRINDLDISLNFEVLSDTNSTTDSSSYEETLESYFIKKNTNYDIILYDNISTTRFGPHLLNLKDVVSDELIELYKPGISSKSCVYGEDKWVGLVTILI